MANVGQYSSGTTGPVLLLAAAGIGFTVLSIVLIASVTHDYYTAAYYTFSALFDAVGGNGTALNTEVVNLSGAFYTVIAISIIDGIIKILIIGFVMASIVSIAGKLDIRSKFAKLAKKNMSNHFILCGYSALSEKLAEEFSGKKLPFLIVEKDKTKADISEEAGYPSLNEDFTSASSLVGASIEKARAVLFLGENDYENLLGVVTARHLNEKVKIIARAEETATITKIQRAGADLCVVPEILTGLEIGEAMVKV